MDQRIANTDKPVLSRSYVWRSSFKSTNKSEESFVALRTNVRLSRFLEFKKLEFILMGFQEEEELQNLFDSPGFFSDSLFLNLMEAFASLDEVKEEESNEVMNRFNSIRLLLGKPRWDFNLYFTYLGNIRYEWNIVMRPIRPFKKYSGYVKSPSTVGSKRRTEILEVSAETADLTLFEKRSFTSFLLSKELDFNLLGFPPGSLLYLLLDKHLKEKKPLPLELRTFLLFRAL